MRHENDERRVKGPVPVPARPDHRQKHPLVTLGRTVDWSFLEERFGEVYTDDPWPAAATDTVDGGLAMLRHTYDLSEKVLCERGENAVTNTSAAKSSSSTTWCSITRD